MIQFTHKPSSLFTFVAEFPWPNSTHQSDCDEIFGRGGVKLPLNGTADTSDILEVGLSLSIRKCNSGPYSNSDNAVVYGYGMRFF